MIAVLDTQYKDPTTQARQENILIQDTTILKKLKDMMCGGYMHICIYSFMSTNNHQC